MNRTDAIKEISNVLSDELVISSCGLTSRTLFKVCDRNTNFYNQSHMGSTLAIAIGLALNISKKVIAIIGDGEALMNLGTLVLFKKLNLPNLKLYILDNQKYESTGGQKTCSDAINFTSICPCKVYHITSHEALPPRIPYSPKQLKERFMNAIGTL